MAGLFESFEPSPSGATWSNPVRLARPDDLPAIGTLAADRNGGNPDRWSTRYRRHTDSGDSALYVGTRAGSVVGYGLILTMTFPERTAPDGLYLGGVTIAPERRRMGLGRALTQARIGWARERTDTLWYFASEQNRTSIALHDRFGFVEGTRDFSIPNVTFTGEGILFRLDL